MRPFVAFLLTLTACGGGGAGSVDSGVGSGHDAAADAPTADAPFVDALPPCVTPSGAAPKDIALVSGGVGVFDASTAHDPTTGRTWLTYSSVAPGPADLRLVSTRLAYTDDGGASFCDAGVINAAAPTTAPAPYAADAAYWIHEVSALTYDPLAPSAERWRVTWHRYLLVDTGDATTERQFANGWIGERRAATPTALAAAPEHKLLAAAGYASAAAYNDAVLGPPEVRLDQITGGLADCAVVSEPGGIALPSARWLALLCGAADATKSRVILLADDRAGHWTLVARLLGAAEAAPYHATGFSAPALYATGGSTVGLVATPTIGDTYVGCLGFQITGTGALVDVAPADGQPDPTFGISLPSGYPFGGACAYDASLAASGVIFSGLDTSGVAPRFRLLATGTMP